MATRSQGVLDKMTKESGVETATLKVFRYRPEVQTEPYVQEYKVPYRRDMVVLDALNYIKDHIDGTLSYRWSCRMGICGSCGANVDGEPKLTCASFLHEFKGKEIKIEPLANFPVIKDLIINIEDFMEKLDHIKPWIIRKEETPLEKGEYRQTPEELEAYKQFSMCINCMLCYAACPIYGMNEEFLGPAATALAYRYITDTRDQYHEARFPMVHDKEGVWECTLVGECSVACPKGVDPMLAIQKTKILGATQILKPPRRGK